MFKVTECRECGGIVSECYADTSGGLCVDCRNGLVRLPYLAEILAKAEARDEGGDHAQA